MTDYEILVAARELKRSIDNQTAAMRELAAAQNRLADAFSLNTLWDKVQAEAALYRARRGADG